jgi:hypothetical protein
MKLVSCKQPPALNRTCSFESQHLLAKHAENAPRAHYIDWGIAGEKWHLLEHRT